MMATVARVLHGHREVGRITIEQGASLHTEGESGFVRLIGDATAKGVPMYRDVQVGDKRILGSTTVRPDHEHFFLALVAWLRAQGYDVVEEHPETDAEIKGILAALPDDQPTKHESLAELPTMSYLEKTYLLVHLRKALAAKQDAGE